MKFEHLLSVHVGANVTVAGGLAVFQQSLAAVWHGSLTSDWLAVGAGAAAHLATVLAAVAANGEQTCLFGHEFLAK